VSILHFPPGVRLDELLSGDRVLIFKEPPMANAIEEQRLALDGAGPRSFAPVAVLPDADLRAAKRALRRFRVFAATLLSDQDPKAEARRLGGLKRDLGAEPLMVEAFSVVALRAELDQIATPIPPSPDPDADRIEPILELAGFASLADKPDEKAAARVLRSLAEIAEKEALDDLDFERLRQEAASRLKGLGAVKARALVKAAVPKKRAQPCNRPMIEAVNLRDVGGSEGTNGCSETCNPRKEACNPEDVEQIARDPSILERFGKALVEQGVAGEERVAKLVFLAVVSRFLERPVSVIVKGPSSGGKSFLVEQVLRFFPAAAFYPLTSSSEKGLLYSAEPLEHRMLVISEAAGLGSDFAQYVVRSLLSEGRLIHDTVADGPEGRCGQRIAKEGPTGLLLTTTADSIHPENETRCLSVTVTDTPEQTRAVFRALAGEDERHAPEPLEWRAFNGALRAVKVKVPFAMYLADQIPPIAVRLRRDFKTILNLIRAHTLLHQRTRQRDKAGGIAATVQDYQVIRGLVADLVAEGVDATVSATVRATVVAVKRLKELNPEGASNKQLAKELKLDDSSASRRARQAIKKGYVRNLAEQGSRTARLVPGDDLPEDGGLLPNPEDVEAWVARLHANPGEADPCARDVSVSEAVGSDDPVEVDYSDMDEVKP